MTPVTPSFFDLDEHQVLFWNFDGLDSSLSPLDQGAALRVDLAQLVLGPGVLLDVGWYPAKDPSGSFVVQAVREGEWETPIVRTTATDWDELKKTVAHALVLAKVDVLKRGR